MTGAIFCALQQKVQGQVLDVPVRRPYLARCTPYGTGVLIFERSELMKPDIHPSYQPVTVTCACGASYATRSTRESYNIDICSACHPFYTGKNTLVDTAGRIDKFRTRYAKHKK